MDPASQVPLFEPLLFRSGIHNQSQRPFTPIAHDLIVLSAEGDVRIARNASARQMIHFLDCSNRESGMGHDRETDSGTPLTVIRFDEDDQNNEDLSPSSDDWSQLWPFLDSCCNSDDNAIDFVTRLRQEDAHCRSSISKNTKTLERHVIECTKLSYSLVFLGRHILLAHHFHKINGEVKEMVRMVTCGISQEKIEAVLCKALLFLNTLSPESDNGSLSSVVFRTPIPHPKAIMCGMLECLEEFCRKQIEIDRKWIEKIEADIDHQRDPTTSKPKGLEINYVKLSETSIRMGDVRQKLQHLLSSIASLEVMKGLPGGCKRSPPLCDKQSTVKGGPDTPEGRLHDQWWQQLREVKVRLLGLKGMSQQHVISIENLQERVKGILSIVSILLAEKENEWSHQAIDKQQHTSDYQLDMIEYQNKMLKQQELIASRTKRDNTVMKVIAVLTSMFLPGTFVATVFSVPIFKWDDENPMGPHFMTYWYVTVPITTTLVVGFSIWFVKMWYDDRKAEKLRAKKESQEDTERMGGVKEGEASLGS